MRFRELLNRFHMLLDSFKERIGAFYRDYKSVPAINQVFCLGASFAAQRPKGSETTRRGTFYCLPQRFVPFGRPAADNKTKLIKDAIKKSVYLLFIFVKFVRRVTNTCIAVVSMNFEHTTLQMNERGRAARLFHRTDHRRRSACLAKSRFNQAIEVGRDYDSNESLCDQLRDGVVACGRLLLSFLAFLFIWLDIGSQKSLPLARLSSELVKQLRIVRRLPIFVQKPLLGIRFALLVR